MTETYPYIMLYGAAAMLSLVACCYLLFRRANAIAPEVASPIRLRRWTAAFLASVTLSHVWYIPTFYATTAEDDLMSNYVGAVFDFLTVIPLSAVVLLTMLQDRCRPLWPPFALLSPLAVGLTVCIVLRDYTIVPVFYVYYVSLAVVFLVYMIRATRQYGRWLRDNYADLEHKEVWQSFIILTAILLMFAIYTIEAGSQICMYITQVNVILLVCYLLWRVETLSDLSHQVDRSVAQGPCPAESAAPDDMGDNSLPQTVRDKIGVLLQRHCVDAQLYLQHDLTLLQLAKTIGTNRTYLSSYFVQEGITYNAYINDLRIQHFVRLYREAVAGRRPFTAQQLSHESGYRSYSTFALAFKQRMGQAVTVWMRDKAPVAQ
ncbi:MAG: helix-turn-helix domain-containing protein [Prevotella sp.]|nr:helix-turn-helix domain-containing protein [Prevotella sp.]